MTDKRKVAFTFRQALEAVLDPNGFYYSDFNASFPLEKDKVSAIRRLEDGYFSDAMRLLGGIVKREDGSVIGTKTLTTELADAEDKEIEVNPQLGQVIRDKRAIRNLEKDIRKRASKR